MEIIDKLGIKCYEPVDGLEYGYRLSDFEEVEEQRDGMLETLIEIMECADYWSEYDIPIGLPDRIKSVIEKATGKSWEEIKEINK